MIRFLEYLGCGILWVGSMILTIVKKNPIGIIILSLMHGTECALIGVKTGLKYGKKLPESIAMCMTFGFTWWLLLRSRLRLKHLQTLILLEQITTSQCQKRGYRDNASSIR